MFEIGKDILRQGLKYNNKRKFIILKLLLIKWFFIILFFIFIFRTLELGLIGTDRKRYNNNLNWTVSRADISDRNGDVLARNIISANIILKPKKVINKDAVASFIYEMFPDSYTVRKVLNLIDSNKRFIYIKKYINNEKLELLKSKNIDKNKDLSGLEIELTEKRYYPKYRLFSHILGFVGYDKVGLEGIERLYNNYLTNNKDSLYLSLDSRIQSIIYDELSKSMDFYKAKASMAILMNSRTGEIISIVSQPDFDPNKLTKDSYYNNVFAPMKSVFELGSVFKIFNTVMAFENGINKTYDVSKPFAIYDKKNRLIKNISDIKTMPIKMMTPEEIMMYSSNPGSAQIALDLPNGTQEEFFNRVNLNKSLKLDFGKTANPLLPKFGIIEKATVSFGHGIAVSPMNVLLAVNSVINGGIYIYPTIRKREVGKIQGKRVISEDVSDKIRKVMSRITEETSGKNVRIQGINIGSKTGTAEKIINGKIDKRKNITSFISVFPIESPQYIMLVILDEPQGNEFNFGLRTAAWNVVPTTKNILEAILPLLF